MSVEEIRARLDKIMADIELQKTVLKQLDQKKCAAQRELNTICDPMERLPLEISSKILLQCLPRSYSKPKSRTAPMLLLNVCSAWTNIALSTPALWTSIHLEVPRVEVLQTWLKRARNHSLSISLRSCLDSRILTVVRQYAQQLKQLKIYDDELADLDCLTGEVSFPRLETLTIGALTEQDEEDLNTFSLDHIMGLLRLAPNLVECTFHNVCIDIPEDQKEILSLPKLRCLKFGTTTDSGNLDGEDQILQHLSLPAVSTLALPFTGLSSTDFSLFLKRSSPPLQKLVLGPRCELRSHELVECLRLMPSLLHLELGQERHSSLIEELFAVLAELSSLFLPRLKTLKILHGPFPHRPFYQKVLSALSARSTQLVNVELRIAYPSFNLDEDIRDSFCSLASGGMKIYIGNDTYNFIFY
ncbi:hypothetical protein C8R45DRAFT_397117 [Mycena sanguinolenta]|nr:hypothetical protein C8R45DRAFT_397117 [Mycena sanguinolenta]